MKYFNSDIKKKKYKKNKVISKKAKFKKVKIKKPNSFYSKNYALSNKYILFIFILFILILLSLLFCIIYFKCINKYKINSPKIFLEENKFISHCKVDDSIDKNTYSKRIQDFIFINYNNTLIYGNKDFKTKRNPKISVILSVRNGEAFIRAAVRSIQNQDLNDVEIIIVDDASEDKSVEVIKNLMEEDGRIIFMQNKENKGILYTRAKGILEARGKYMLILDVDDLFAVENAFSIMYEEAEKNNLDILGFVSTQGRLNLDNFIYTHFSYHNNLETSIISQPELSKLAFNQNSNGDTIGFRDVVWGYLFKTELFKKIINEISDRFLNEINNSLDDLFLFFILVRRAKALKYIKKVLYVTVQEKQTNKPEVKYFNNEKKANRLKYRCLSNLSYPEFLLIKTNDDYEDKKLASFALKSFFLNGRDDCRKNMSVRDNAIKTCKLFLENKYIEDNVKNEIKEFLKEANAL